jgi:predicted PurR-regulated permease PerM
MLDLVTIIVAAICIIIAYAIVKNHMVISSIPPSDPSVNSRLLGLENTFNIIEAKQAQQGTTISNMMGDATPQVNNIHANLTELEKVSAKPVRDRLISPNGTYSLVASTDGHLLEYRGKTFVWNS